MAWNCVNCGNSIYYRKLLKGNDSKICWDTLREKRTNATCYIIGNGPSLTPEDLKILSPYDCFVSNGFYRIQDQIDFIPTYYVIQDRYCMDSEKANSLSAKNILFGDYFCRTHTITRENVYCFPTKRTIGKQKIIFGNLNQKITDAYTVTFSMIQIAVSLGYKNIYLLGIDHNYPFTYDEQGNVKKDETITAHFYRGEKVDDFICNVEGMNRAYLCAKEFADSNEIKIINVTRGGKLEVFDRKNLEDAI